jgi:hypothetical protein
MNAEETLARLRKEYDVTLPSGLQVTIRLPRIRDCIIAGNVPLPVLAHIQDVASNGQADLSPEELASMARFQDEIVRRSLIKIDGEDVVMTPEAVAALEQDDYDALVAYGTRQTPVPTNAVSPT